MDYATLIGPKATVGSIAYWLNYAPATNDAAEFIDNAQDELFARLRLREMRKSLSLSLSAGDSSAPLPADYLDAVTLVDPYGNKVKRVSDDRVLAARTYDATGTLIQSYPSCYGVFDQAFQFTCGALTPITVAGLYYGATQIGPGSGTQGQSGYAPPVLTNVLTQRYSHLFRATLLKHANAFYKDMQQAAAYQAQAEDYIARIEEGDDLSYRDLDDGEAGDRL